MAWEGCISVRRLFAVCGSASGGRQHFSYRTRNSALSVSRSFTRSRQATSSQCLVTVAQWVHRWSRWRGTKSEVAHKWAEWLHHTCHVREGPQRFREGDKIRIGPHVGGLTTSRPPYGGSPTLQSGGQNQKWPTSGQVGYITPAMCGRVPKASERGSKSELAHKWADWLHHTCHLQEGPQHFREGDKIRTIPHMGGLATSPLP